MFLLLLPPFTSIPFLPLLPLRMAVPQGFVLELYYLSLESNQIILPSRVCRMLILSISAPLFITAEFLNAF